MRKYFGVCYVGHRQWDNLAKNRDAYHVTTKYFENTCKVKGTGGKDKNFMLSSPDRIPAAVSVAMPASKA